MTHPTYPLKLFVTRPAVLSAGAASLALNIALWIALFFMFPFRDSQIFLHYTVLFGVDYIDAGWKIFGIPLFGLLVILVNFTLGWLLFSKDRFAAYLLGAGAVLAQVFLCLTSLLLIFLNG